MKKSNAQAETHSNRAGAPRTSPADCDFLEQKHLATGLERHVVHVHFFLFIHRLQAQAELTPSMCEIFK